MQTQGYKIYLFNISAQTQDEQMAIDPHKWVNQLMDGTLLHDSITPHPQNTVDYR